MPAVLLTSLPAAADASAVERIACLEPARLRRVAELAGHRARADAVENLSWGDTRDWREVRVLRAHEGEITPVGFSPRGRFAAAASEDGALRLWSDR
jgi:WD40 repeat protein